MYFTSTRNGFIVSGNKGVLARLKDELRNQFSIYIPDKDFYSADETSFTLTFSVPLVHRAFVQNLLDGASRENYLCEFSHPAKWRDIYCTIIDKLGPRFHEWDKGMGFECDETVLVISHQSGGKARVLLKNIGVCQPAIAGGWFTTLREATEKKKLPV